MPLGDHFPRPPSSGDPITAVWARLVCAALWAVRPIAGKGIRISPGPRGCVIEAVAQPGGGGGNGTEMPFDAAPSGNKVKVLGGRVFALTSATASDNPAISVEDAEVSGASGVLVLEVYASYSLFSNPEHPGYTLSAEFVISDGEPDYTGNGLFVNIPSGFVSSGGGSETTVPVTGTSGTEVLLPLSPSGPDPECTFRIPLADVVFESGKVKSVVQRKHGDIGIPLAINWRVPFVSEAEG